MSIDVTWIDDEQSILFAQFSAQWTWEEYDQVIDKSVEMTSNTHHRIDQIVDLSQTSDMPEGSPYKPVLRGLRSGSQPPVLTVYIGIPTTISVFIQVLNRLQQRKNIEPIKAADLQEAIDIIKKHRAKD